MPVQPVVTEMITTINDFDDLVDELMEIQVDSMEIKVSES
jgi:hypothetical protein